jgi:2-polyprenyl-3-methyl-5-hydroxy-6-metoxy-1,4-benzoquinol methylase
VGSIAYHNAERVLPATVPARHPIALAAAVLLSCAVMLLKPIASQYLDGEYYERNPSFHVEDSSWKAQQIMRMVKLRNLKPRTVAEVGCGAGEILVQLSKHLPDSRFVGYELSPQAFELCKPRANERIDYFNTDLCELEETVYDLVLCIDVFEHIEDYFTFLRRLWHRGRGFIFHIPLDMNVQMVARSRPIMRVREAVGHLHYFSKDTALVTLRDCAYQTESWIYTPSGIDRPKSFRARALRIPRKILFFISQDLTAKLLGGYSLLVYALPLADRT